MGIAQTGTVKHYYLPVLKTWKYNKTEVQLYLSSSYTNWWCCRSCRKLTEDMSTRVLGVYGGVNINTQKLLVYEGVDILWELGRVMGFDEKMLVLNFERFEKLIIDEFDEMLSLGFRRQLEDIFTMMSERRQNILFLQP